MVSDRPNVISQKPWSNQVRPAKPGPRDIFQVLRLPDDVVRVYKETRKIKELYGLLAIMRFKRLVI